MASLRGKTLSEVALIVETHTKEGLRTLNQHCNKRNRAEMRKYAKPDEFLGAGDPNLRKVNTGRKRSIGGKQIV